jgi:hypothetical protein
MATTWRCRACLSVNEGRKRRCGACGNARPKRRRPSHLRALDIPYEEYVLLNGGERCGVETCARTSTARRRLDRDHDHRTGAPRGLLCPVHNRMLTTRVTPDELRALAAYLERHEARAAA